MRCLLVSLFTLSVLQLACGRSALDMPGPENVSCQIDDDCPTGGVGGTGVGWGGTEEPAGGGVAGTPSWPEPSAGGRAQVPAGNSAVAGAIAGMPIPAGSAAGNPATPSSSVGGQPGSGGASLGGRLSVTAAGTTSIVGGSGGASRTSSSSSRPNGEITFRSAQAQGFMTGYAWVSLGQMDMMTSPICDTGQPITNAMPCTTLTKWSTFDSLCMSGSIPALPASPVQADYDNNWGMEIGVNASEPPDAVGPDMSSFTTVAFTFSGIPKTGVRAFVHRKGDPDATTYCVDSVVSTKPLTLTKFNTKCWGDPATVHLSTTDLPYIDKIGLMVSSTSSAIIVSKFCMERILFN